MGYQANFRLADNFNWPCLNYEFRALGTTGRLEIEVFDRLADVAICLQRGRHRSAPPARRKGGHRQDRTGMQADGRQEDSADRDRGLSNPWILVTLSIDNDCGTLPETALRTTRVGSV